MTIMWDQEYFRLINKKSKGGKGKRKKTVSNTALKQLK